MPGVSPVERPVERPAGPPLDQRAAKLRFDETQLRNIQRDQDRQWRELHADRWADLYQTEDQEAQRLEHLRQRFLANGSRDLAEQAEQQMAVLKKLQLHRRLGAEPPAASDPAADLKESETKKQQEFITGIKDETAALAMSDRERFIHQRLRAVNIDAATAEGRAARELVGHLYDETEAKAAAADAQRKQEADAKSAAGERKREAEQAAKAAERAAETLADSRRREAEQVIKVIDPLATYRHELEKIQELTASIDPETSNPFLNQAQAAEAMSQAYDQMLGESKRWEDGAIRAMRSYAAAAEDSASAVEDAVTGAFKSLEDAAAEFATSGMISVRTMVDSIIADLARMAVKQTVTAPLAKGLADYLPKLFGGIGGGSAATGVIDSAASINPSLAGGWAGAFSGGYSPTLFGVLHDGAVVDGTGRTRAGPSAWLAGAGRYHAGLDPSLGPGEFPAILMQGEGVFTPRQMENADRLLAAALTRPATTAAAVPEVIVNVIDQRGGSAAAPVEVQSRQVDHRRVIDVIVADSVNRQLTSGTFDSGFRHSFGARRQGVSR